MKPHYNGLNEGTSMMVNNIEEEKFFLSSLKKDDVVLEFGCGVSTLAIAPLVKNIFSVEHNFDWVKEMQSKIHHLNRSYNDGRYNNISIIHTPANNEPTEKYSDGTYKDFKDYVNTVTSFSKEKFDVIFIDGRARVSCAYMCIPYLKPGGSIFIHDYAHPKDEYRRYEYEMVEVFLIKTGQEFAMAKFATKNFPFDGEKFLIDREFHLFQQVFNKETFNY